jgi:hypothetical protein
VTIAGTSVMRFSNEVDIADSSTFWSIAAETSDVFLADGIGTDSDWAFSVLSGELRRERREARREPLRLGEPLGGSGNSSAPASCCMLDIGSPEMAALSTEIAS